MKPLLAIIPVSIAPVHARRQRSRWMLPSCAGSVRAVSIRPAPNRGRHDYGVRQEIPAQAIGADTLRFTGNHGTQDRPGLLRRALHSNWTGGSHGRSGC
jgi:hypothetical protein